MATQVERLPRDPRAQLKARRHAFWRRHWRFVAAVCFGTSLVTALVIYFFLPAQNIPVWVLGPAVTVAAFWAMRSQFDGTYHLESGIEAEGWTSRDLRKALGRGWHVIDDISFGEMGNIDHVAVGRAGVFAVETKYSDSTLDSRKGRATVDDWIEQSYQGARRIRLLLRHNYGQEISVLPIVVTSGTEFLRLPAEVEDVDVVRRRNLSQKASEWRGMSRVLSRHQVESIRAALLDWRGIREDYERSRAA